VAVRNIETQEVTTMYTQLISREGRIVDRLVEIIIVMFCMIIGPFGLTALNALPALPVA